MFIGRWWYKMWCYFTFISELREVPFSKRCWIMSSVTAKFDGSSVHRWSFMGLGPFSSWYPKKSSSNQCCCTYSTKWLETTVKWFQGLYFTHKSTYSVNVCKTDIIPEIFVLVNQKALFMSSTWAHWYDFLASFFIFSSPSLKHKRNDECECVNTLYINTIKLRESHAMETLKAESMDLVKENRTSEGRVWVSWKPAHCGRPVSYSVHLKDGKRNIQTYCKPIKYQKKKDFSCLI